MPSSQTFHFVHRDPRVRATLARAALARGHHAEVYSDVEELLARPPRKGIVIIEDDEGASDVLEILTRPEEALSALPFAMMAEATTTTRVVTAMKAGALDYFELPMSIELLGEKLTRIHAEAIASYEMQRSAFSARQKIASLTNRERQVLDLLGVGRSSKAIGLELEISPRTVEIHRANLLAKLGVGSAVEAVRVHLEAASNLGLSSGGDFQKRRA